MKKEWFEAWFDSPYYHLLYKGHNEQEARNSLDNLLSAMGLKPGARIMDLACGKGRHSRYLAEKGFFVTGLDISEKSIAFARQFESEQLEFYQHDMRKAFRTNYFDGILNMFTSFGYFKTDREHQQALLSISQNLKPGGLLLLDYFSSPWVRANLVPSESKTVEGVTFQLRKWIDHNRVYKNIAFDHEGQASEFTESVRLFELADFEQMFAQVNLKIIRQFGAYDLSPYNAAESKRLILVAEKTP